MTGLNDALLAKAAENKVVKTDKVRADTTVVEADVCYPTDSGLLAKGVAKLARLAAQLKAAGLATGTTARDRTRSVRRRAHAIGAWLRRRSDDAKEEAKAITGGMGPSRQGRGRCPPRRHQRPSRPAPQGDVDLGTAPAVRPAAMRTRPRSPRRSAPTSSRRRMP